MFEHEILPLFDEWRRTVPIKRMLPHDDIVRDKQRLLTRHIDIEVRIGVVQIMNRDIGDSAGGRHQRALYARVVHGRMRKQHQYTLWRRRPLSSGLEARHVSFAPHRRQKIASGRWPSAPQSAQAVLVTGSRTPRDSSAVTIPVGTAITP